MASPGELMASAVERTGLEDFGDDSFREGLEILVKALRDEARLNDRGEGFIYARIGMHLRQRLQVEDWYRRHPEIDDVAIDRSAVRARPAPHRFHRAVLPARTGSGCPVPAQLGVLGAVPAAVDRAGRRSANPARAARRVVGSRHHVPTDVHGPMECLDLMALDFKSQIFQAFAQIPTYSEWLVDKADFTSDLRLRAARPQTAAVG